MDIRVEFPGGKRVDARFGDWVVNTDQGSAHGGEGSAPEPFQLFLASLASCAGVYVLAFCQARGISTEGIELTQEHTFDPESGRLSRVKIRIAVPESFPKKYVTALERVAAKCTVKRVIQEPPEFQIEAKAREAPEARATL